MMASLGAAQGQLATFEFNGTLSERNSPTSFDARTAVSAFSLAGGLIPFSTPASANDRWLVRGWNQGTSLNTTQYGYITISAANGSLLDLTQLNFQSWIESDKGPINARVGLFINDEASPRAAYDYNLSQNPTSSSINWDFSDVLNVNKAEFRFYGWSAKNGNNGVYFDSVIAYGSVGSITPVPEPYEYGLIAVAGLLGYGIYDRRRLKRA
jgi:hypothetical protein